MMLLTAQPLSKQAFSPFGQVIEIDAVASSFDINGGNAQRFHDLAQVDVEDQSGRPLISVFRAMPRAEPVQLTLMERHPLGSQAFMPLTRQPYLIVVADDLDGRPGTLHAFVTRGWQGVNYGKGVWHHPLLALREAGDFIVIDRGGPGCNLEEHPLTEIVSIAPLG
ncbi:ureidoglycolate lyase [Caenimonas soli]|uniref:ureidoglycolate lyase n=1 Tax=Caenimonas soli TaxID=2735555 RepID=UPI0015522578|nr:ureidoglycolate lyase [Caenimonas soli]NPC55978.1 ureidoglycolate lyase [Caenimonas soli]